MQFVASLFSVLAVLALVLSSIGLYSVISYTVSQTTKELAIHVALGATRGFVFRRQVLSAGASIGVGLCLGSAACVAPEQSRSALDGGEPCNSDSSLGVEYHSRNCQSVSSAAARIAGGHDRSHAGITV